MEVRSIYKYARISPFKVREVTREIQGLPVSAALDVLAFTPKKAAFLIGKTLKSAIANAENNANLKPDGLVVKEATGAVQAAGPRVLPLAACLASQVRMVPKYQYLRPAITISGSGNFFSESGSFCLRHSHISLRLPSTGPRTCFASSKVPSLMAAGR